LNHNKSKQQHHLLLNFLKHTYESIKATNCETQHIHHSHHGLKAHHSHRTLLPTLHPLTAQGFSSLLIRILQQVSAPSVARDPAQRRKAHSRPRRLQARPQPGLLPPTPRPLVRPLLGPPRLRLRRLRTRPLRHRRLRRVPLLQRHRRHPAGHPGGVHPGQRAGLLRREPGGRVQPAHLHHPLQGIRKMQLRGLRERPEHHVPGGPSGAFTRQQARGGLQERLLRLQLPEVLLHGLVRKPAGLQAHGVFEDLQERMSEGLLLRLR